MTEEELLQEIKMLVQQYAKDNNLELVSLEGHQGGLETPSQELSYALNQILYLRPPVEELLGAMRFYFPDLELKITGLVNANKLSSLLKLATGVDLEIVKGLLVDIQQDINATRPRQVNNVSLLWMAVKLNDESAVKILVALGADPNVRYGQEQKTILMSAIDEGIPIFDDDEPYNLPVITALTNSSTLDPDVKDSYGRNVFEYASENTALLKLFYDKYGDRIDIYETLRNLDKLGRFEAFLDNYCDSREINLVKQVLPLPGKYGHLLGLSGTTPLILHKNGKSTTFPIKLEGATRQNSLELLVEVLRTHPQDKTKELKQIYDAGADSNSAINWHLQNDLSLISSGWKGHTVGIVVCGDYLAICNRGDHGDQNYGTMIYHLKNKEVIAVLIKVAENIENYNKFKAIFEKYIDFNDPVIKVPQKGQEHGTCSFANIKASLYATLLFQVAKGNGMMNDLPKAYEMFKSQIDTEYKAITKYIREFAVDDLIKQMKKSDQALAPFYADLMSNIINQHSGKNSRSHEKAEDERKRALRLFTEAPLAIQMLAWKQQDIKITITDIANSVLGIEKSSEMLRDLNGTFDKDQKRQPGLHFAATRTSQTPDPMESSPSVTPDNSPSRKKLH